MTNAIPNQTPADALRAIIAAGVARYQASLPDFARDEEREPAPDEPAIANISGVTEERQLKLCLSCHLAECVDVTDSRCPIRIEQLRVWRERRRQ